MVSAIDRTIQQLEEEIKAAKEKGDYQKVERLEKKLEDAKRYKSFGW